MFRFKTKYLFYALLIFLIEVAIALWVHDKFIRPFVGDFLVVVMIYFFLRGVTTITPLKVALITLLFSFVIEFGQLFHLVNILGLEEYKLARIVIGTSFSVLDLVAYLLGVVAVYLVDIRWIERKTSPSEPTSRQ